MEVGVWWFGVAEVLDVLSPLAGEMFSIVTIFFLCRPSRGEDYIELAQIPARFTCSFLDVDVQLVYFTTF